MIELLRRARWIWPEPTEFVFNSYAQFRHDFRLPARPRVAPFFITADQQYQLFVNGQYVGRGPARGYQQSWPYDEYDLAPFLRKGHNWISIRGYNAGRGNFQYIHQSSAGMLCAAKWGNVEILSGPAWLMRMSPAHRRQTGRLSIQLNWQEHADLRQDDQAWIHSPRIPKGWHTAWGLAFGAMPWHGVEPRGIPNLAADVLPYRTAVAATAGRCAKGYAEWPNPLDGIRKELAGARWATAPAGRRGKAGLTVDIPAAGKGKWSAVLIDMGHPTIGTASLELAGAQGGEMLDFYFTEWLHPDGTPYISPANECGWAAMVMRLWARAGRTRFESFQMIGHRYVVAVARDTRKPLRLTLACRQTVYPFEITGSFRCSDAMLNDIYRISVNTQRVCSLDSYVDTPWREQAQWWGDARVQAQNTFHISGDARLLARGIRSIARQEVPNGLTYGHAPTTSHFCVLPDFSLIWLLTMWDHYYQTGDVSLFREQWPRAQRVLSYFTGESRHASGLLKYDPRYWLFLDWTELHKDPVPSLLNLWYVLALEKLAALAGLAGMPAEQKMLARLYAQQKNIVLARLWDAQAGLFHDGLDHNGKRVHVHSIHTQTLAILCGLRPSSHRSMIDKCLLPYLQGEQLPGGQPSSYWVTYVYSVMQARGYGREVVAHIRRNWEQMIPYGGTWESFVGPPVVSVSHAWAAHPIYHLAATLGGIRQTAARWDAIRFEPVLGDPQCGTAETVTPTPHGLIKSAWKRTGDAVEVHLSLPKGISAEVALPGLPAMTNVRGSKRWKVKL